MQKLWPHQEEFIKRNPNKEILAWEMRVGKSLPASLWVDHPSRSGNTYIISPKQNKKDWIAFDTKATVLSKEEFKKATIENPTAIVVDEAHYFLSPLFLRGNRKRSQLAEKLYNLVRMYPNMHILLLTATPIRQDAWSLHTLLCYVGVYYDWRWWREQFFEEVALPFLPRKSWMKSMPTAWMPKKDWRFTIRQYLEKHCNIISLRDIIADLPPIVPEFIHIKQPPYKKPLSEITNWMHEHHHEQKDKYKEILNLEYRKVIVVAQYRHQIDELKDQLSKDRPVFVLDGRTKDAGTVKRQAQEADDCYFIVQSSMGFGWDGYMFGALVFTSMSHSCLDHTQMLGRIRHVQYNRSIPVYYLLGGRWDCKIYDTIERGLDFNPHVYDATSSAETE